VTSDRTRVVLMRMQNTTLRTYFGHVRQVTGRRLYVWFGDVWFGNHQWPFTYQGQPASTLDRDWFGECRLYSGAEYDCVLRFLLMLEWVCSVASSA